MSARAAMEADALFGLRPGIVLEPDTLDEAAADLQRCAREKLRLLFVGGGTDLGIGSPPSGVDAVLRTSKLSRVLECVPSDQVVTVECGVTLSALQKTLALSQQCLAIDPPFAERATLGGIVAANAFGPRRARFGSIRDLIIGLSFVRADGALVRGGGKVVKNVAGFDLPKLLCGSLGTLGLIATATFRVHPLPELSETLRLPRQSAAQVRALARKLADAQLEPTSVVATEEESAFTAAIRFEGFAAGVRQQREKLRSIVPCELLSDEAAREFWEHHEALRTSGTLRAKIAAPIASFEQVAAAFVPVRGSLRGAALIWYPTLGLGFITGAPGPSSANALAQLRIELIGLGGSLVVQAAPHDLALDAWGPPPASFPLLRSVKERLDPERRLAPGRFVGGL